jgi:hypothetical protein
VCVVFILFDIISVNIAQRKKEREGVEELNSIPRLSLLAATQGDIKTAFPLT